MDLLFSSCEQCSLYFSKVCVCIKFLLCNIYQDSSVYGMMCIKYVLKTFLKGNFVVRSEFSCVRSSHDLCACAHAHSLQGTLVHTWWLELDSNLRPSGHKALNLPLGQSTLPYIIINIF